MPGAAILPGMSASVSTVVSDVNTARTVGSGSLDVFATPMMIALMELAACECLADCLDAGQASVGTEVSVEHVAASPVGAVITASATVESVDGRKIVFSVSAHDGVGEIGKGLHTRFLIDEEKFMSKANARR